MRILLANSLFPDLGIGGSEQSVHYLARGLSEIGHQVAVFSQNVRDETVDEVRDGVAVRRAASRPGTGPNILADTHYRRLAAAVDPAHPLDRQLAAMMRAFKPDVVNTSVIGRLPGLWAAIKAGGATCVHTLRAYSSLCGRRMIVDGEPCVRQCRDCGLERRTSRERSNVVDGVVGIGAHVLDVHLRAGWFRDTPQKAVIGNSYAPSGAAPAPDAGGAPYEFGYIGRLHPTKGVDLFLEALEALRRETGRPHRAIVAGSGDARYEGGLKRRFEGETVHFAGYMRPEAFFSRIRWCVVPSVWFEPFGRIFIESLHHGVPVVGSRRGGGPEIVEDGATGFLFEPERAELTAALARASAAPDAVHARMRAAALARAEDYGVAAIARRYEAFYERARETAR